MSNTNMTIGEFLDRERNSASAVYSDNSANQIAKLMLERIQKETDDILMGDISMKHIEHAINELGFVRLRCFRDGIISLICMCGMSVVNAD